GRSSLKIYYDMFELLKINALWVLLTLPILTAPGAMAGLFYSINKLAKNEPINASTFFEGFRNYFWMSWRWTLLNLVVFITIYMNYDFYQNIEGSNLEWLEGIFLGLGIIWSMLQLYIFPLLIEQSDKRLLVAVRNSVLLFFRHPGPSYSTAIVLFMFTVISVWLFGIPWLIFLGGLSAYLITTTLMYILGKTKYVDPVVR
ncbi:MAG: YesL family protein, partial [Anaerolineales bacterium]|nr:YesL family protein [Anaerolineales bacterium]